MKNLLAAVAALGLMTSVAFADSTTLNTKDGKVMTVNADNKVVYSDGTAVVDGTYQLDNNTSVTVKDGMVVKQ